MLDNQEIGKLIERHTFYIFDNFRIHFFPQSASPMICPDGYRIIIYEKRNDKWESDWAFNMVSKERPSESLARKIIQNPDRYAR